MPTLHLSPVRVQLKSGQGYTCSARLRLSASARAASPSSRASTPGVTPTGGHSTGPASADQASAPSELLAHLRDLGRLEPQRQQAVFTRCVHFLEAPARCRSASASALVASASRCSSSSSCSSHGAPVVVVGCGGVGGGARGFAAAISQQRENLLNRLFFHHDGADITDEIDDAGRLGERSQPERVVVSERMQVVQVPRRAAPVRLDFVPVCGPSFPSASSACRPA